MDIIISPFGFPRIDPDQSFCRIVKKFLKNCAPAAHAALIRLVLISRPLLIQIGSSSLRYR